MTALLLLVATDAAAQTCEGAPLGRYDFVGGDLNPVSNPPVPDNMSASAFSVSQLVTRLTGQQIAPPRYRDEPLVVRDWDRFANAHKYIEFTLTPDEGYRLEMNCLRLAAGSSNHSNMRISVRVEKANGTLGLAGSDVMVQKGDLGSGGSIDYNLTIAIPSELRIGSKATKIRIQAFTTNTGDDTSTNAELAVDAVHVIGRVVSTTAPPPSAGPSISVHWSPSHIDHPGDALPPDQLTIPPLVEGWP